MNSRKIVKISLKALAVFIIVFLTMSEAKAYYPVAAPIQQTHYGTINQQNLNQFNPYHRNLQQNHYRQAYHCQQRRQERVRYMQNHYQHYDRFLNNARENNLPETRHYWTRKPL